MATAHSWVLLDTASPHWEGSVKDFQSPAAWQDFIFSPTDKSTFAFKLIWKAMRFALKIWKGITNTVYVAVSSFTAWVMNILQQKGGRHTFAWLRYWEQSKQYFVSSLAYNWHIYYLSISHWTERLIVFFKEDQIDHELILGTSQIPKIFFGVWQVSSSLVRLFCSLWYLLALREYKKQFN